MTDLEDRVTKVIVTESQWSTMVTLPYWAAEELAIAAVAAALEWQPIETAPHDGTEILVFESGIMPRIFVATWNTAKVVKEGGYKSMYDWVSNACTDNWEGTNNATHWLPLPPSPKPDKKPDNQ